MAQCSGHDRSGWSLSLFVMTFILSACSQTLYVKDGATPQELQADQFDCEQKVFTMYGGLANMGPGHAVMARQDIGRCLMAKGYREATTDDRTAAAKPLTPEEVWRTKSGTSKTNEYPRPTTCVGQGCTATP